MTTETTPLYLDRAGVRRHFGLTRVDVERCFRALPQVSLAGSRKVYIRASDLLEHLEGHLTPPDRVRV